MIIGLIAVTSAFSAEVTLLKRTIQITPQKYLRYWNNPKASEPIYNTNSWSPRIKFDVIGPIESGSRFYVEFDKANGTPWFKQDMKTPSLIEDEMEEVTAELPDSSIEEKLAGIEVGTFNFRIKFKNALTGAEKIMFSGKYKVNQLTLDQTITENKGKKEFMVDYDWHLPLGYVWVNPEMDEEVPIISTQFVFKGNISESETEGFLFYNGKQISKSSAYKRSVMTSGANEPHHRYTLMQFNFDNVRAFNKSTSQSDFSSMFFLDKNKGNYEIKILRANQLVRTVNFTVGQDGKIVDNSYAKSINLGGVRLIFPAKISGTLDGTFNANAWQTDAIWGNVPIGLAIQ